MEQNIVAVDITSTYPDVAKAFPSIGYVRNLSAEGLLSLSPTLILDENDMGPSETMAQLKNSGIEYFMIDEVHSSWGILDKFICVARIIDREEKAQKIVRENLSLKIKLLEELVIKTARQRSKVMFVLSMRSGSPIVGGKSVSADRFIKMFGGVNSVNFQGWKPVGPEAII